MIFKIHGLSCFTRKCLFETTWKLENFDLTTASKDEIKLNELFDIERIGVNNIIVFKQGL